MMTLSKSEIHRLLIAVDRTQVSGQRDFLLFSFLEHTGLGVRECSWVLTGLVSDLGVPNQVLHITVPCRQGAALHKAIFLGPEAQGCIQAILKFNSEQGFSTAPASPLSGRVNGFETDPHFSLVSLGPSALPWLLQVG